MKYIVGNKSDLEERRQVSTEEATDLSNCDITEPIS